MNDAEYTAAMNTLAAAGRIVLAVDVDELRNIVARSEALGPVLEATAYHRGGGRRLAEQREFLDAAATFRAACERLRPAEPGGG